MGLDMNYKAEVFVDTENLSREDWLPVQAGKVHLIDVHNRHVVPALILIIDRGGIVCPLILAVIVGSLALKDALAAVGEIYEEIHIGKHERVERVAEHLPHGIHLQTCLFRENLRHKVLQPVPYFFCHPVVFFLIHDRLYAAFVIVQVPLRTKRRHSHDSCGVAPANPFAAAGNNENEFFIRYMERDLDIEEDLIAEEEFFWTENVEKGVEPPYTEKPDLVLESIRKHCGPADKDADAVKLDRKYLASIRNYLELKEQKAQHEGEAKKLDEKMKEAYAEIVQEMGTSCTGVLKTGSEEYMVSYNPAYRTGIDKKGLERLKVQHPDVYDDYVNTTESRRFSVKVKGAA